MKSDLLFVKVETPTHLMLKTGRTRISMEMRGRFFRSIVTSLRCVTRLQHHADGLSFV